MSIRWSWCGALCMVACTFESAAASPNSPDPAADTSGGQPGSTAEPSSGETTSIGTNTETSPPATTTSPTIGEGSDSSDTGETGDVEEACPQPLPDSWVLCEDFEDVADLASQFSVASGTGMGIGGPGYNSPDALEITHFAQQAWVGQLRLRFGQGPGADNIVEPATQFDEVWVRMRFRTDEGWPGGGPGGLLTIEGVQENPGWGTTFQARISADQNESSVFSAAYTCVFGGQHLCTGTEDWTVQDYLGGELGQVPVFDEAVASDWHCAVVHARLNTAENSDGLFELLVDGQPEVSLTGLDFRGARTDLGFNLLSFPTFTQTPPQNDRRRYVDDVVVSTQALDCE